MLWNTTWMEQKVWNPKNQLTPQVLFCADEKPAWGSVCVRSVVHSRFQVPSAMFSEMFQFWSECFFQKKKNEYGHQAKFQPPVSRPVLEVAPNILLEPAQHLRLLPLHRVFVPVHISGLQGRFNFRWNWQWDQNFHRTFVNNVQEISTKF